MASMHDRKMVTGPSTAEISSRRQSTCSTAETNADPFAFWCCELRYEDRQGRKSASGVLVEIPALQNAERFPGLRKVSDKIRSVDAKYALLVAHHAIPGLSAARQGWTMYFTSVKKTLKLEPAVVGAASCCGADSIVVDPDHGDSVLKEHPDEYCELKLDFTVLFLNSNLKSTIATLKRPPSMPQLSLDLSRKRETDLATLMQILGHHGAMQPVQPVDQVPLQPTDGGSVFLYHRQEGSVERIPVTLLACNPTVLQSDGLRKDVSNHKLFQNLYYQIDSNTYTITSGFSGSPIVYFPPGSQEGQLIGIHIGDDKEEDKGEGEGMGQEKAYVAVSICGMVQLIQGDIVACLSFMRNPQPRRLLPTQWTELFQSYLLRHQQLDLRDLLNLLYLLLEKHEGTRLVILQVRGRREDRVVTLNLLTALFSHFKKHYASRMREEIETKQLFGGDNNQEAFIASVRGLCESMLDLLTNVEQDRDLWMEESVVSACFQCWNAVLNFKYKGIVCDMLTSGNGLGRLGRLWDKYQDCLEIQRSFGSIHMKCRLYLESKHKETLDSESEEFAQKERNLRNEIQVKDVEIHEMKGKLQQNRQEIDMLNQQKGESEESKEEDLRRKTEEMRDLQEQFRALEAKRDEEREAHQQMEQENRRLSQQVASLQDTQRGLRETLQGVDEDNQTLRQEVEAFKESTARAETASQQHYQKVVSLRARNKQLDIDLQKATDEKETAEYQSKQQVGSMAKLREENEEVRQQAQSLSQQVEEHEAAKQRLSDEVKSLKEQLAAMRRQVEDKAMQTPNGT